MDPLKLLRDFNVNKKDIIERNNQIIFGEFSWPKNINTNYRVNWGRRQGPGKDEEQYYTLECLLFILKNIHLIHPEYCKEAAAAKIQAVRRPDRKKILEYLNGEIDECESIDKSAPLEKPTQVKREHHNESDEPDVKKPHIKETNVQKVEEQQAAPLDAAEEASGVVDDHTLRDPLTLLRDFNVNKKEIVERDNQIILGEFSWQKNVKTNYLVNWGRQGPGIHGEQYYTLECLLFILKNSHLIHPEYCKEAAAAKIQAVRRPDRKKILEYLNGEIDECESIDKSAPLEKPTQVKREHAKEDGDEPDMKKPRIKETHVQKVEEN